MRMWPVVRGCWVCWTSLPLGPRSCGLCKQLQNSPGYTTHLQESVLGRIDCWSLCRLPGQSLAAGAWQGGPGRILHWEVEKVGRELRLLRAAPKHRHSCCLVRTELKSYFCLQVNPVLHINIFLKSYVNLNRGLYTLAKLNTF